MKTSNCLISSITAIAHLFSGLIEPFSVSTVIKTKALFFLKRLNHSIFLRISIEGLIRSVIRKNVHFFSFIFLIGHVLAPLLVVSLLIIGLTLLTVNSEGAVENDPTWDNLPELNACLGITHIRSGPHRGSRLDCENAQAYFKLIKEGKIDEAAKLLHRGN